MCAAGWWRVLEHARRGASCGTECARGCCTYVAEKRFLADAAIMGYMALLKGKGYSLGWGIDRSFTPIAQKVTP